MAHFHFYTILGDQIFFLFKYNSLDTIPSDNVQTNSLMLVFFFIHRACPAITPMRMYYQTIARGHMAICTKVLGMGGK